MFEVAHNPSIWRAPVFVAVSVTPSNYQLGKEQLPVIITHCGVPGAMFDSRFLAQGMSVPEASLSFSTVIAADDAAALPFVTQQFPALHNDGCKKPMHEYGWR